MKYRVHLVLEHDRQGRPHGAGIIRLLRPLRHPRLAADFEVSSGTRLGDSDVDVVIVDRTWRPGVNAPLAQRLVKRIRAQGAAFVYNIDDNLLDLHIYQPWHEMPNADQRAAVRLFVREADLVLVSTPALAKRLRPLNPHVQVIPNTLDETLFPPQAQALRPRRNAVRRIGYMGTLTHTEDLMLVLEPLRALLQEHSDSLSLELVGVTLEPRVRELFKGLALRILNPGDQVDYERFVPWATSHLNWDLAIAPLANGRFNFYKSDIKFLDYALLGIPGVYSRVEAYRHSVIDGETGWVCEDEPESWHRTLSACLSDPRRLQQIRRQAWGYAQTRRCLRTGADMWRLAIQKVLGE